MEKKSKHIVGSIVCGILTAFGIVASVISIIGGSGSILFFDLFSLVLSVLIGYYALWGYKKPHGNLLKFILLAYAAFVLAGIPTIIQARTTWWVILNGIVMGSLCFMSGRLDRIKQNACILAFVTAAMAVAVSVDISGGNATIGIVTGIFVWLDICVAYFLRYKEHREAGLADAPKK